MADELLEYLSSDRFTKASVNATRLVAKLRSVVQKQEFYEAHQIIRTIYSRFINNQDKVRPLEHLLYLASIYLSKLKENVSGQDIALLYLETAAKCLRYYREDGGEEAKFGLAESSIYYHRTKMTIDLELSQKVAKIAAILPESEIGKTKYLADALRILSPKIVNSDILQNSIAIELYLTNDFHNSRYLYLHCAGQENVNELTDMLVSYQRHIGSDVDLFVTQFIFQFLYLQSPTDTPKQISNNQKYTATNSSRGNSVTPKTRCVIKRTADDILRLYARKHPTLLSTDWPYTSYPLLNFTHFVISIIDTNTTNVGAVFELLREIYRVAWSRDPNFLRYLDRIATIYFGVIDDSKQRQGGGFINNILLSLLEAADDDEERDSDEDGTNNPPGANNLSSFDELD